MFKLMGRIQNWVLTIAGVATAGLFGISTTDIQGCIQSSSSQKLEVSVEERKLVMKNLRIGSILNDTSVPSDQLDEVISDYASQIRQAEVEGIVVSNHELGMFFHQQFGGKDKYNNFTKFVEQRYGLSVGDVEGYYRDIILFQKLSQLSRLSLYITQAEILGEYHRRNDAWVFDRISADSKLMIPTVLPSEEDLKAWFEDHAFEDRFRIPEQVTIEYLMVSPNSLEIAEAEDFELREFYNQNRDKYPSEEYEGEAKPYFEVLETVRNDHKSQAQKSLAKRLLDVLDIELLRQENPDFNGLLASKMKDMPELSSVVYGKTKPFAQSDFRIEPLGFAFNLTKRVFGANPRNYGGVLEAGNGLYIYRVIDRREEGMMDFSDTEAREQIEAAVEQERKSEMALNLLETWKEKIVASGNWAALELPVGLNYERKEAKGVYAEEGEILADLMDDEISSISPLSNDHVILKVVERLPADVSLLEEQKESLKQSIWRNKAQDIQKLSSLEP
jgi:hypothetical protein